MWPRRKRNTQDPYGHFGRYRSFDDALANSGSYDIAKVAAWTQSHTRSLMQGRDLAHSDIHLFAALQYALALLSRPAYIVDFGGALGAHYFSMRRFLDSNIRSWLVVELPETAAHGAKIFGDEKLSFSAQLAPGDIVIASGVLQCVPEPYRKLAELKSAGRFLLMDKIPLHSESRLTVHRVHPQLFGCEFAVPAWFFEKSEFLRAAGEPLLQWEMAAYRAMLDGELTAPFCGMLVRS